MAAKGQGQVEHEMKGKLIVSYFEQLQRDSLNIQASG